MIDKRYKQKKAPAKQMVCWRATADEVAKLKFLCDTLGRESFSDLLRHLTREAYKKNLPPNITTVIHQS